MEITYVPLTAKEKAEKEKEVKKLKARLIVIAADKMTVKSMKAAHKHDAFGIPDILYLQKRTRLMKLFTERKEINGKISDIQDWIKKGNPKIVELTTNPLKIHKINGCK